MSSKTTSAMARRTLSKGRASGRSSVEGLGLSDRGARHCGPGPDSLSPPYRADPAAKELPVMVAGPAPKRLTIEIASRPTDRAE